MRAVREALRFSRRYRYIVTFVISSFVVLAARLWYLQIARGQFFFRKTSHNFVQTRRIRAPRGLIFDRHGRIIVTNRPSYDIYVTPYFATANSISVFATRMALEPDQTEALKKKILAIPAGNRRRRLLVLRNISRDHLARWATGIDPPSGFSIEAVAHRNYEHGNVGAHLLGYLSEVTQAELEKERHSYYRPGSLIGRFGIERMYETQLRGISGLEKMVIDAQGHEIASEIVHEVIRTPRRIDPRAGYDLMLTLDLGLQKAAERSLSKYPSGAAIVVEVDSGRLLASASRPSFDPNTLTGRMSATEYRRLLEDPYRPLIDRVVRENYFPGSTYKVVTALAALEEGAANWNEKIYCRGFSEKYRLPRRCGYAHGMTNLHRALVESCNIFFYALAERIGLDKLAKHARRLGLGTSTGLGLNYEVGGFIPTREWYLGQDIPVGIGYALNAAIGQGNVKVTPLQLVLLYAAIANGGKLYLPQIVEKITAPDGTIMFSLTPRIRSAPRFKKSHLKRIVRALSGVVSDPRGTAHASRLTEMKVAGKTGTAQLVRSGKNLSIWQRPHSWFAGFAPAAKPSIAIAVIIEHGGSGAMTAAPVAMGIIAAHFGLAWPPPKIPDLSDAEQDPT